MVEPPMPKSEWSAWKKWGIQALLIIAVAALSALLARVGLKVDIPPPVLVAAPDGPAETITEPLYFCGRVETVRDELKTRPWPVKKITWHIDTAKSPLPSAQVVEAFRVAWASWAAHLDIEPVFVDKASEALVQSKFGQYDGSGKVLAWSELADGTTTAKHQLYDQDEKWGVFGANGNGIDLVRVAAHEIGHVLGLLHDEGKGDALMDPVYSRTLRFPTEKDVSRAIALGYKPKPTSKNDPPPMGPLVIDFKVSAKADDLAEALRKAGFKIEAPKP